MPEPRPLSDVAAALKSANAGASWITFDIFFDDAATTSRAANVLTTDRIARLYGVDAASVRIFVIHQLDAIKITIPRATTFGSLDERDFDGTQQHIALLGVEV